MDPIRVLIADDHDLFVEVVSGLLEDEADIELAGRARNGEEAIELAADLAPDIVVMDVEMPVLDGLEATRRLREAGNQVGVVVVTGSDVEAHVHTAREVGADAYLAKSGVPRELVPVIRAIAAAGR